MSRLYVRACVRARVRSVNPDCLDATDAKAFVVDLSLLCELFSRLTVGRLLCTRLGVGRNFRVAQIR